jgi:hypothetical protein
MRFCVLLVIAACFPYRELYRPDLHGRVVDEAGAPVAGMTVTSCAYTHWSKPPPGTCPRSAETVTDGDGGFAFPAQREWEWCCLGEAPLPQTEVYACAPDAGARIEFPSHGLPQTPLVLQLLPEGAERCVPR